MDNTPATILIPLLLVVVSSQMTTDMKMRLPSSSLPWPTSSSSSSSSSPSWPSSSSPSSSSLPSSPSSPSLCPCVPTPSSPALCPTCFSLGPSSSPSPSRAPPAPLMLVILRLIGGSSPCGGRVYLELGPARVAPVCEDSDVSGSQLCQWARCGELLSQSQGHSEGAGYHIQRDWRVHNRTSCTTLEIQCDAGPNCKQLVVFKTLTGLLFVLVLLLFLVKFGPHIYSTARKRWLGRRKREWIGPTESQSVSFYRTQAGLHPNSNTDKRLSYPGLERLTVNSSREPSSNRNSNSYD